MIGLSHSMSVGQETNNSKYSIKLWAERNTQMDSINIYLDLAAGAKDKHGCHPGLLLAPNLNQTIMPPFKQV